MLENAIEVSIIVPVKDESDPYIDRCLESLKKQKYRGSFEILVIKGGNPALARNLGIKRARGEIIAFIDSDCVAPENWLLDIAGNLRNRVDIAGVGGTNFSPETGPELGKAIDFVYSSYLGSLNSASLHGPPEPKFVSSLACINSAFWQNILRKVDGFDEEFDLCEDTNLGYKVRDAGYALLFTPKVMVWHYRRDTVARFAKQFFLYGIGMMRSILTEKKYARKGIIVPFASALVFPLVILAFPLASVIMAVVYFGAVLVIGFRSAIKANKPRFLILIPSLLVTQHLSYFLGMLYGVTKGKWKYKKGASAIFRHLVVNNSVSEERFV